MVSTLSFLATFISNTTLSIYILFYYFLFYTLYTSFQPFFSFLIRFFFVIPTIFQNFYNIQTKITFCYFFSVKNDNFIYNPFQFMFFPFQFYLIPICSILSYSPSQHFLSFLFRFKIVIIFLFPKMLSLSILFNSFYIIPFFNSSILFYSVSSLLCYKCRNTRYLFICLLTSWADALLYKQILKR